MDPGVHTRIPTLEAAFVMAAENAKKKIVSSNLNVLQTETLHYIGYFMLHSAVDNAASA